MKLIIGFLVEIWKVRRLYQVIQMNILEKLVIIIKREIKIFYVINNLKLFVFNK